MGNWKISKNGILLNSGGRFIAFTYGPLQNDDRRGTHQLHFFLYIPFFKKKIIIKKFYGKKGNTDIHAEFLKYGVKLTNKKLKNQKGNKFVYEANIEINK